MFSVKGKVVLIDNSLFTLGTKIVVADDGSTLLSSTIDPSEDIPSIAAGIIAESGATNVFVKGINQDDSERLSKQIEKSFIKSNFSRNVDKIHYHMI